MYRLSSFIIVLLFLLTFSLSSRAELGIKVGINIWSQDLVGDITYQGDHMNTEDDLGIDEDRTSLALYFQTKKIFPFFPDFRFFYDSFDFKGTTTEVVTFGENPFIEGVGVSIGSQTLGVVGYYSYDIFQFLEAQVGVDVRKTSFDVTVSGKHASTKNDLEISFSGTKEASGFIPLLYGQLSTNLPYRGMYTYTEVHITRFFGNYLQDNRIGFGLELLLGIHMEAGYRRLLYNINNDENIDISLVVSGTYIDLNYAF